MSTFYILLVFTIFLEAKGLLSLPKIAKILQANNEVVANNLEKKEYQLPAEVNSIDGFYEDDKKTEKTGPIKPRTFNSSKQKKGNR